MGASPGIRDQGTAMGKATRTQGLALTTVERGIFPHREEERWSRHPEPSGKQCELHTIFFFLKPEGRRN